MHDSGLRLTPLGGLGEFGLNALAIEWRDQALLLDAGMMFPGPETLGVDSIVPDFQYLAERKGPLCGIVLTHGHEDHIGGVPFALQAAPAPVYGTGLTLALTRRRLEERGAAAELRTLRPGEATDIGPFRVHPIRVAHSVTDSVALAIETPAGVVLASGDFKMSHAAPAAERTDCEALAAWGEKGVLVLLSDSTNVEQKGHTPAEDDVLPAFRDVLSRTPGRVLVSCFASSIPRIQRIADLAQELGRRVAPVGRRMVENIEAAQGLGLFRVPDSALLDMSALPQTPPEKVLLFVSGSQGEPLSALSMISVDEHPSVSVGPGDTVVLSARAIPGNERGISRMIGNLFRRGCDVVHPGTAHVHVSGHGSQEDLLELLALVRPKYFVPVHGEYRMLAQHARLAVRAGMPSDHVLLAEDGDVLEIDQLGARRTGTMPAGRVLLDRSGTLGLPAAVIKDRRHLSSDGIVVPIVVVDKQTGRVESPPEIVTRGFVDAAGSFVELLEDAGRLVLETVAGRPPEEHRDPSLTRERVRLALVRFFRKRTGRRPMVIPVVMEL